MGGNLMTNTLHLSGQEQATGNGITSPEPNLLGQNLIVSVSQISVNLLGNIVFKVQHSADGSAWVDVPNFATGAISATGTTTVSLNPVVALLDCQRVVWTFNNANSVTFAAYLTGAK